jgi:hypothetical protein
MELRAFGNMPLTASSSPAASSRGHAQQTRACPAVWLPRRLQIHHGRSVTMADRVLLAPPWPYRKSETSHGRCHPELMESSYSSALARPTCSHTHFSGTHHCFLL